jgi:hypothetical protein
VWNEAANVQVPVTAGVFACLHEINISYSPWCFFVISSPPPTTPTRWWFTPRSGISSRQSGHVTIGEKNCGQACGQQGDGTANLWRRVCGALHGLSSKNKDKTTASLWAGVEGAAALQHDLDLTPEELDRLIEAATVRCTASSKRADLAALDASPPRLKRMVSRSFLGSRNMDFILGLPKGISQEDDSTTLVLPSPTFSSETSVTLSRGSMSMSGKN